MRPTKTLPAHYRPAGKLVLSSRFGMIILNVIAIPVLFFAAWFFARVTRFAANCVWLRAALGQPEFSFTFRSQGSAGSAWGMIVGLILTLVIMVVAHELLHGLFYWIFSGDRPRFGFKGAYAYAAAPDWYFPRKQYLVIGLAPLVIISVLGSLAFPLLPASIFIYVYLAVVFNFAGAVGDMVVTLWVLLRPRGTLLKDTGDEFYAYAPGEDADAAA